MSWLRQLLLRLDNLANQGLTPLLALGKSSSSIAYVLSKREEYCFVMILFIIMHKLGWVLGF